MGFFPYCASPHAYPSGSEQDFGNFLSAMQDLLSTRPFSPPFIRPRISSTSSSASSPLTAHAAPSTSSAPR
jgi:hypothetical protein